MAGPQGQALSVGLLFLHLTLALSHSDSQVCQLETLGETLTAECVNISQVSDLTRLRSDLTSLNLRGCSLQANSSSVHYWDNLASLDSLKITHCDNASEIFDNFKFFTKLRSLTVRESSSDSIDIACSALRSLEYLDLSDNLLKKFTPPSCPQSGRLKTLKLSGNELTELDWADLEIFPNLQSVNLSSNPGLAVMRPPSREFPQMSVVDLSYDEGLDTLCNTVLLSLPNLTSLHLTGVRLTNIPPALLSLPVSEGFQLENIRPLCSCQLVSLVRLNITITCQQGEEMMELNTEQELVDRLGCVPAEIIVDEDEEELEVLSPGVEVMVNCKVEGSPPPTILWLTPRHELLTFRHDLRDHCDQLQQHVLSDTIGDYTSWEGHFNILHNGSLLIDHFGWRDRGQYQCYADNMLANSSTTTTISLDHRYRQVVYLWSLLYGLVTAVSFLALTLLGKLIHHLAWNYGCCYCCSCCHSEPPPKIKRLTAVVDSIEQYRIGQLEKLRENYALQSQRIRDNYSLQLEKLRENYTHGNRAENWDNVNRVREYSNMQLTKLHENYIFQRQRLRKFSAQNYLKIRETGKYTQKTLNRVIENMPTLTEITNCRGGPDWDDEEEEEDGPVEMLMMPYGEESQSLYFTPSGTPHKETVSPDLAMGVKGNKRKSHKRMVSNLSNFLPFWWGMGQSELDSNCNNVGTTATTTNATTTNTTTTTTTTTIAIVEAENGGSSAASIEDIRLIIQTDSETNSGGTGEASGPQTETETSSISVVEDPK